MVIVRTSAILAEAAGKQTLSAELHMLAEAVGKQTLSVGLRMLVKVMCEQ